MRKTDNNLIELLFKFRLICAVLCLLTGGVAAQYRFETWTTENGLPYKEVRSVRQARDGYLWATTKDGLARFDGVRFTVFNTDNSQGLVSNRLTDIVQSNDGSLWIGSDDSGLTRFKDGVFTNFTIADGLPSNEIVHLFADITDDSLTIVTTAGTVRREQENFTVIPVNADHTPILDNRGALWFKRNNRIYRQTRNGEEIFGEPLNSLPAYQIVAAYQDSTGGLWVSVGDIFNAKTEDFLFYFKDGTTSVYPTQKDPLTHTVRSIIEDDKHNMWFGTWGGGLVLFSKNRFRSFDKQPNLASERIPTLAADREGGVWIAGAESGLTRISPQLITSLSTEDGLAGDNIYPLFQDTDNSILIGTWEGLDKYADGQISHFLNEPDLVTKYVTSIFRDRAGTLWIGASGGLTRLQNGEITKFSGTEGVALNAIFQDRTGDLWFGYDRSLVRLKNGEFQEFELSDNLRSNNVHVFHQDRAGILWIGTTGGLAKFVNEQFTFYTEKEGLSGNYIRSIYEDADGALWFGTFDNGLTRLKDGKFTSYRVRNGLYDQGAFHILEDERGWFWISSNRGIYRVSKAELNEFADGARESITSIAYGVKDGMRDAECNGGVQGAGIKTRDGQLWFPTQKGVAIVNPALIFRQTEPPPIAFEEFSIDRQPVDLNGEIELTPDSNALEIRYTGLSFDKPEQIRFRYRLAGLDKNWTEAGTRRTAFYNRLPPGEYVFEVSAANAEGIWRETAGASVKISVKPPFWRTWWFWFLTAILIFGATYFFYRQRIDRLEKSRRAQEDFSRKLIFSQEQERQRIAAELHDSIGQELLIIKNWAMLGLRQKNIDGAGQNQFDEISQTASQAIEEVREISYNLRPYQIDELGLTKAVKSMIKRMANSSTIEFAAEIDNIDGFFPQESEINFYRIVQECLNNIVKHSAANEAVITIKLKDQFLHLSVGDNGKGFDTAAQNFERNGFGLQGIEERTRILGGKLEITSAPGKGTTVNLIIKPGEFIK